MWNDNDTNIDLIDFNHLVSGVRRIIDNEKLVPCTIGIYGDWGSGKSSLMRMVQDAFESKEGTLTIKFNGWLFEGYDDAKAVLMGTILEKIVENRTLGEKAKKLAIRLFKKIDWFKIVKSASKYGISFASMGPAGLGIAALSDIPQELTKVDYEKFIKTENGDDEQDETLRMSIRNFHEDFAELLETTKINKLIVFIDDLDRCNPETIIEILEAIKLFLFVENTTFVISADEKVIEYAVRKRFPEIPGRDKEEVGRDYLEKLIQFPVWIPQLSVSEIEIYINLLFTSLYLDDEQKFEKIRAKVIEKKSQALFSSVYSKQTLQEVFGDETVPDELESDMVLSSQITPVLTTGLKGNPRQCKRFLNMLLMRLEMAKDKGIEIQKRILSKLMLLEYFKPETFKKLFEIQIDQDGCPAEIQKIEDWLRAENGKQAKSKDAGKEVLEHKLESWLGDSWLREWFSGEPLLGGVDLRPYFYFSRDTLGTVSAEVRRMSPVVLEIYNKLVSESQAINKQGLSAVSGISLSDATLIFSSITEKINQAENTNARKKLLKTLTEFCKIRQDLLTELIAFLEGFPEELLPVTIVPQLRIAIKNTPHSTAAERLITSKWSKSPNKSLAKVAASKGET